MPPNTTVSSNYTLGGSRYRYQIENLSVPCSPRIAAVMHIALRVPHNLSIFRFPSVCVAHFVGLTQSTGSSLFSMLFSHSDFPEGLQPGRSYSSKMDSTMAYGGPLSQDSSRASDKQIAAMTLDPMSVHRQVLSPQVKSIPILNSACSIFLLKVLDFFEFYIDS